MLTPEQHQAVGASAAAHTGGLHYPGMLSPAHRHEDPVTSAVSEAFGGIFSTWANPSAAREIDYKGVSIPFYGNPDENIDVPLCVVRVRSRPGPGDNVLTTGDWQDWVEYVERDIGENCSLLVTEVPPAADFIDALTPETESIWSDRRRACTVGGGQKQIGLSRLDLLASVPPACGFSQKVSILIAVGEVFHRYMVVERQNKLESDRQAELRVASLSVVAGDSVAHEKYGFGTVVSVSGYGAGAEAIVDFGAGVGIRQLVLAYAPLSKL